MTPVVFHHGFFNFFTFGLGKLKFRSFSGGIEEAIADRGHPLIVSKVHPTAGIARRAGELKDDILRQLDQLGLADQRVIILAHSMGGLDARYMISELGMANQVEALATISTPHRGTPYADFCRRHLFDRLGGFELADWFGLDVDAVRDMTFDACARFNEAVIDSPLVKYYSVSGARLDNSVPAFAYHPWKIIYAAEGPNDGLVSVRSSTWGKHLGVWPLDHWHQVNKRFIIERNGPGNAVAYYQQLLDRIADENEEKGERLLAANSAGFPNGELRTL